MTKLCCVGLRHQWPSRFTYDSTSNQTQVVLPSLTLFVKSPSPLVSVQQRKQEQERARKAVEEKSAEVKREKEALSKKQELETAHAAEQAKRKKLKAEEERQVRMCLKTCTIGSCSTFPTPSHKKRVFSLSVVRL